MLFKTDSATIREKAAAALATLQRNASAMAALRSRIESRLGSLLNAGGSAGEGPELARVLALVKSGELALGELAGRVDSTRFLEEFIGIMGSAAVSVGEIKGDMEQMVPEAESVLQEMQETISAVSGGLYSEPAHQEAQQRIMDEAATATKALPAVAEVAPAQEQKKAPAIVEKELEAELA